MKLIPALNEQLSDMYLVSKLPASLLKAHIPLQNPSRIIIHDVAKTGNCPNIQQMAVFDKRTKEYIEIKSININDIIQIIPFSAFNFVIGFTTTIYIKRTYFHPNIQSSLMPLVHRLLFNLTLE